MDTALLRAIPETTKGELCSTHPQQQPGIPGPTGSGEDLLDPPPFLTAVQLQAV